MSTSGFLRASAGSGTRSVTVDFPTTYDLLLPLGESGTNLPWPWRVKKTDLAAILQEMHEHLARRKASP